MTAGPDALPGERAIPPAFPLRQRSFAGVERTTVAM